MKTITKSVRLSPIEAEELKQASERECMVESNLLKKIFLLGMRQVLLDEAANAYLKSEMSISEIADYYNIPYGDVLVEFKNRNIQILDERIDIDDELSFLSRK